MKAPPPRTGEIHEGVVTAHVNQYSPGKYYLRNLSTHPDFRGQGYGTHFMHNLLHEHDAAGTSVTLHTARPELVKWYRHLGFHTEGEDDLGVRMTRAPHERMHHEDI